MTERRGGGDGERWEKPEIRTRQAAGGHGGGRQTDRLTERAETDGGGEGVKAKHGRRASKKVQLFMGGRRHRSLPLIVCSALGRRDRGG